MNFHFPRLHGSYSLLYADLVPDKSHDQLEYQQEQWHLEFFHIFNSNKKPSANIW